MDQAKDYFQMENDDVRRNINLQEILDFQLENDVQIIRGEDYQYCAYINKKVYCNSLTPMHALVFGIEIFKAAQNEP